MLNIDSTAPNSPMFTYFHHIHDFPVECDDLDLNPAVQTQLLGVDGFAREGVVPLYIWNHKNASKDFKACIQQNGDQFGYIALNDLKIYRGPEVTWKQIPSIIQAHKLIRQSGVPNFLNCRIPGSNPIESSRWRHYLADYWDKQLPDLIQYGVPLDFNMQCPLSSSTTNHAPAHKHATHVEEYIREEFTHGALNDPFEDLDLDIHISPLMAREKQNSTQRRTIMDLSWPKGFSVNDAIHKCKYLDSYFYLQYRSVDHIIKKVKEIGPGALLYKVDISRAFKHICIDPGDIDLLGLHYKHTYLETTGSANTYIHTSNSFFHQQPHEES